MPLRFSLQNGIEVAELLNPTEDSLMQKPKTSRILLPGYIAKVISANTSSSPAEYGDDSEGRR